MLRFFFLMTMITTFSIYLYNRNKWVSSYLRTNDEFSNESSKIRSKKILTGTGIIFLIVFYFGIFFYSFDVHVVSTRADRIRTGIHYYTQS